MRIFLVLLLDSTCVIGQHMSIRFTKGDVGHVFGIPSSGT
jgi:hypothetical protein